MVKCRVEVGSLAWGPSEGETAVYQKGAVVDLPKDVFDRLYNPRRKANEVSPVDAGEPATPPHHVLQRRKEAPSRRFRGVEPAE